LQTCILRQWSGPKDPPLRENTGYRKESPLIERDRSKERKRWKGEERKEWRSRVEAPDETGWEKQEMRENIPPSFFSQRMLLDRLPQGKEYEEETSSERKIQAGDELSSSNDASDSGSLDVCSILRGGEGGKKTSERGKREGTIEGGSGRREQERVDGWRKRRRREGGRRGSLRGPESDC